MSVSEQLSDILKDVERLEESREYWIKRCHDAEYKLEEMTYSGKYPKVDFGPKTDEERKVFAEVQEKVDRQVEAFEEARERVIAEALKVDISWDKSLGAVIEYDHDFIEAVRDLQHLNKQEIE